MFLTDSTSDNSGHTVTLRSSLSFLVSFRSFGFPQCIRRNQAGRLKF